MRRLLPLLVLMLLFVVPRAVALAPPAAPPAAPGAVTLAVSGQSQLTATWAPVNGATGYAVTVYDDTRGTSVDPTTATSPYPFSVTVGHTYRVGVRATGPGGTSDEARSTPALAGQPYPGVAVSISGTAQTGRTLTSAVTGALAGSTLTYHWMSGGSPIAGATAASYVIRAGDVGASLTVAATLRLTGWLPTTVTSAAVLVGPGVMTAGRAWIDHPIAGATWSAGTLGWPAHSVLSYAWTLDGRPVSTASSYSVASGLLGHRVGLTVTGTSPGHAGAVSVSVGPVRVQRSNPLAGGEWLPDLDHDWDGVLSTYRRAKGADRAQLAKIALQPRAIWFTEGDRNPRSKVRQYIADSQQGDPNELVELSVFREWPRGENGRGKRLSAAEKASYRHWVDQLAAGIGTTRVAIVLEPDLALDAPPRTPGTLRTKDPKARMALVRYAARKLSRNPNAAVYLDAGDADWQPVSAEVKVLRASGIAFARGFALGATHYSSVSMNIGYAAALSDALASAGLPGKHAVIDTADNGRPFTWTYWNDHRRQLGRDFDNAATCSSASETSCDTLGPAPTWQVADTPGLSAQEQEQALAVVDGYLWFGRPWLKNQAWPPQPQRMLRVAETTPFQ